MEKLCPKHGIAEFLIKNNKEYCSTCYVEKFLEFLNDYQEISNKIQILFDEYLKSINYSI